MNKWVENSDNLQKIVSSALEEANKEKVGLQAQVVELTVKVANLRQQLNGVAEAIVNEEGCIQ